MRDGTRCPDKATDVDHVTAGDNHHIDNLQALCSWHHKKKTAAEANAKQQRYTNKRPKPKHPGLL